MDKATACIALIDQHGQVLCTYERNGDIGVPGGKWDEADGPQTDLRVTALRELLEETGIVLAPERLSRWVEWAQPRPAGGIMRVRLFLVRIDREQTNPVIPDTEVDVVAFEWLSHHALLYRKVRPHVRRLIKMMMECELLPRSGKNKN